LRGRGGETPRRQAKEENRAPATIQHAEISVDVRAPNVVPAIIADLGDEAGWRYSEFFTANIRNPHTRRAYARACSEFFGWCGGRLQIGMAEIKSESVADFSPESVADFPREYAVTIFLKEKLYEKTQNVNAIMKQLLATLQK
jgi:hypothetical protein